MTLCHCEARLVERDLKVAVRSIETGVVFGLAVDLNPRISKRLQWTLRANNVTVQRGQVNAYAA
jgi:hypothetical protein